MSKPYTHNRKVRLRNKIEKLIRKGDCMKVVKIIRSDSAFYKKDVSQNSNGLFMYFHELEDETYEELAELMKDIKKRDDSEARTSELNLEESTPYAEEEFPSMKGVSAKIKYSNREKNLIKRKDYDRKLNENTGIEIVRVNDITTVTSSDTDQEKKVLSK